MVLANSANQKRSALPGYEKQHFRVHNERYLDSADMEPPTQVLYSKQAEVPRLPVPALQDTRKLFLRSARPHVSENEYATTEKLMEDFVRPGGLGEKLQARLEARKAANPNSSWLSEWWNNYAYLSYRDTVVWNVSYYLQFDDEGPAAMLKPTRRAARFVSHSLPFREAVASGTLSPDMKKGGVPMSNTQWKYLFNACRVPGQGLDTVRTYAPDLHSHIVVARKNRFFVFDVYDPATGTRLSVDAIERQFDRVVAAADSQGTDHTPIGVLTAGHRDDWLAKRNILVRDAGNEDLLRLIESSIFMVCLDDQSPVTRQEIGRALLHSDGRNRFWDKSFMAVFFANGKGGYIGEHSMMDGLTTTRFVNDVLDRMFSDPESNAATSVTSSPPGPYDSGSGSPIPEPQQLNFVISPETASAVKDSECKFDSFIAGKELNVLMFHGYGKNKIKTFKVSPDAFAQLAIQLAYRRTFGHCRGTYESTQTRSFLHGRTEVTRSVSLESEAFCDAMTATGGIVPTPEKRAELLRAAASAHVDYIGKASKGLGVDRHLLGLKLCLEKGESHPLFQDPGFSRSSHWAISTSGLVGEHMDGWGFGEVVPDGIGVGYSVMNDRLRFTVSSAHKWADRMVANLERALIDMAALFSQPSVPRSKL